MIKSAALYSLGMTVAGLMVWLAGVAMTGEMAGVTTGVLVALAVQLIIFWGLFVLALPQQATLAHGIGILIRFLAVGVFALMGVPAAGLPPAPTLFSMVACLFVTTLLEPVYLRSRGVGGMPTVSAAATGTAE